MVANQHNVTQTVVLEVSGYLPFIAQFASVLAGGAPYSVSGAGEISIEVT